MSSRFHAANTGMTGVASGYRAEETGAGAASDDDTPGAPASTMTVQLLMPTATRLANRMLRIMFGLQDCFQERPEPVTPALALP